MVYKVWIHKLSFNLSRGTRWRLAMILTFDLFLGVGIQMSLAANSQLMSAPAQDQDRLAAQRKFEEGKALDDQGTAESLRLAVKKYEEALSLWRAVGDRRSEAMTLNNIGQAYNSLGDNQRALDFKDPDDRRRTAREFARSLKEAVEKPPLRSRSIQNRLSS